MSGKIKLALESILEKFKSGEIPEVVSLSMLPYKTKPCAKWSLLNRALMIAGGTLDARGFNQWKAVNRFVKKGAKAIVILAPRFKKEADDQILKGFLAVPVFRYEDTDGEPLPEFKIETQKLPLYEVALSWGLHIKAIPKDLDYCGYYSKEESEIALATEEESVFFHELAHAAQHQLKKDLKNEQNPLQEIVAELSAQALCQIVGKTSKYLGNSYRYIEHYAQELEISPLTACLKVIGEVEQVLNLILSLPAESEIERSAAPVLLPGGYEEVL